MDQNTIRLLQRTDDDTNWTVINRTTITPTTTNIEISFSNSFAAANTTNYFFFNTTDSHTISDTTAIAMFNTTYTPGSSAQGVEEPIENVTDTDGQLPQNDTNTTVSDPGTSAQNDTDQTNTSTNDTADTGSSTTQGPENTDNDSGTEISWLRFFSVLVIAIAAIGGYLLYLQPGLCPYVSRKRRYPSIQMLYMRPS
jgi:hypothetical protein